jgi:hypothetical protein
VREENNGPRLLGGSRPRRELARCAYRSSTTSLLGRIDLDESGPVLQSAEEDPFRQPDVVHDLRCTVSRSLVLLLGWG